MSVAEKEEVDRKYARFMAWLDSNGAELYPGIELFSVSAAQRGVKTSETISAHSTIVSIPLECLITDQMGREQTTVGKIIFSPRCDIQLSAPALLAVVIFILEHQRLGGSSFFHPYLDILPTDWSNFPVFWSEESISTWLQGSPLQHDVRDRLETMEQDYEEIVRVAGREVFDSTLEEFLHVRTCVGSRNFGIQVDGQKRTSMVPFADMLNHLRPRQTSWTFDSRTRSFTITSLETLGAHAEVMDSYGKKDNARFLLHYGFAVEGNREEDGKCPNELLMEIYCEDDSVEACKTKLALLGSNNQARYFKLSMHRDDRDTSQAIAYARILVATEDELLVHVLQSASQQQRFFSLANEVRAVQCIAKCCQAQLLEYSHTFEHNVQRLAHDHTLAQFSAERSALVVITGEQEICEFWIYLASTLAAAAEEGEAGLKLCKQRLLMEEKDDYVPWSKSYWERDCAKHVSWLLDAIAHANQ